MKLTFSKQGMATFFKHLLVIYGALFFLIVLVNGYGRKILRELSEIKELLLDGEESSWFDDLFAEEEQDCEVADSALFEDLFDQLVEDSETEEF